MAGAESIFTFALGFLIASLIALVVAAPMWRRAEKVTRKRLESSLPVSVEDIAADKDKLRADFAISTRKLELNLEKLRKKSQGQMSSVQLHNTRLIELETELKSEAESNSGYENEIGRLTEKLASAEADLKRRTTQMDEMKTKLGELQSVLDRQAGAIKDAASLAESHRGDIETLKSDAAGKSGEITRQAGTISTLDTRLAECGERVAAQKLLVAEKAAALKTETALTARLKTQIAELEATGASARSRIEELEVKSGRLSGANKEIETLKTQINAMAVETRTRTDADRLENANLRQRIGDLAAEVQRMTDAIDNDESAMMPASIKSTLPKKSRRAAADKDHNGGARETLVKTLPIDALDQTSEQQQQPYPGPGEASMVHKAASLADRIRSLQRGLVK